MLNFVNKIGTCSDFPLSPQSELSDYSIPLPPLYYKSYFVSRAFDAVFLCEFFEFTYSIDAITIFVSFGF